MRHRVAVPAVVFAAVVLLAVGLAAPAVAATPPAMCSGGAIAGGTYPGLTVTGACSIPDDATVTVNGNLTLAAGSSLDAVTLATVHVNGNVKVGTGALLGLGCTVIGVGWKCAADSDVQVTGNIIATAPLTMYLDGVHVGGSVASHGGGPGVAGTFYNFAFKDNVVGGNVSINGWQGGWLGLVRNQVTGNISVRHNGGSDPDSTEIVGNTSHNLACIANVPAAQLGDAGGNPNDVSGRAGGECSFLVPPTMRLVTPASGPAIGGTKVRIVGRYLHAATSVMFGTVAATSFTVNAGGTAIVAYAPAEPAGTVDVSVATPMGTTGASTADQYTYVG